MGDATEASLLWPGLVSAATKGKLLPPAEAEATLASEDLDAVDRACALLQTWCWVRGMPPIDRLVAHPRTKGPLRPVADYDVFFEAMGVDVTTERHVMAYPWRLVQEPSAPELGRAREALAAHAPAMRAFRLLDLELELRDADAARGRRRPPPERLPHWEAVHAKRAQVLASLTAQGVAEAFLRPPGRAPYPPPAPRVSAYAH